MMALRSITLLGCLIGASALTTQVTPVQKVMTLLKALQMKIQGEGKMEAASYDSFACFCKDTTSTKSKSVISGRDTIDVVSADIAEKTATKADKESSLTEAKKTEEHKKRELEETKVRCAKEKAEYMANDADLSKAISSLKGAIDALVNTGGTTPTLLGVRSVVAKNLALAEALKMVNNGASWKSLIDLSVDPDDPAYKYHSNHVVQMLHKLQQDFSGKKADADGEWAKTKKAGEDEKKALSDRLSQLEGEISNLNVDISKLGSDIATHRSDLVNADGLLKDDQLYLKDLTKVCELRANEWDQRTQMRAGELEAIGKALALLTDGVYSADEAANERALLVQTPKKQMVATTSHKKATIKRTSSFIQQTGGSSSAEVLQGVRKHHALDMLRKEGSRLGSSVLSSVANQAASDPFTKVKQLIQKLVERLLDESTQEATKKGFCDESLAKAKTDRTFRWESVMRLNGELAQLEAKKKSLEFEIEDLGEALTDLAAKLKEATRLRGEEKTDNLNTIDTANEGLKALSEAIIVLRTFYSDALKASLVQTKLSPVEEDTSGPGFEGAYKGAQSSSKGILGMLDVIKSDFQRTVRKTTQAEKEAAAAFVLFDRATKSDISGKSTKKELDEEDLATTTTTIASKMEEMGDNMDLVDKAVQEIEALKPMCIDTGMSYAERVQKREDEVAALKKALCILDPEQVEDACNTR